MEALTALIGKLDDPTVLILVLVCCGLAYMWLAERREGREDRKMLLEAFNGIKDAMHGMRETFAELIGRLK